jgi:hypothetical protein
LKTKWIRSAARTSISILSELVLRYEVWSKGKDKETTPADDLSWDEMDGWVTKYQPASANLNV